MSHFPPTPGPNQVFVHHRKDVCSVSFDQQVTDSRLLSLMSPQEWAELAQDMNASMNRHNPCTSTPGLCTMCIMVASCGMVFCPFIMVACMMQDNVRRDMERMSTVQALKGRGVSVAWYQGHKHILGGLMFTSSQGMIMPGSVGAGMMQPMQMPQVGQMVMVQQPDGSLQQMVMGPNGPQPVVMLAPGEQPPEGATVMVAQQA